jgi:hypothetical protein
VGHYTSVRRSRKPKFVGLGTPDKRTKPNITCEFAARVPEASQLAGRRLPQAAFFRSCAGCSTVTSSATSRSESALSRRSRAQKTWLGDDPPASRPARLCWRAPLGRFRKKAASGEDTVDCALQGCYSSYRAAAQARPSIAASVAGIAGIDMLNSTIPCSTSESSAPSPPRAIARSSR